MSKKDVSRYLFWTQAQQEFIPPEKIPDSIDLSKVVEDFSHHKHHLGAWPKNTPLPTPHPHSSRYAPITGYASHVVREVTLTDSGGLLVSFDFINTMRGHEFMEGYYEDDDWTMVPVLDDEEINIVRFDFHKELKS